MLSGDAGHREDRAFREGDGVDADPVLVVDGGLSAQDAGLEGALKRGAGGQEKERQKQEGRRSSHRGILRREGCPSGSSGQVQKKPWSERIESQDDEGTHAKKPLPGHAGGAGLTRTAFRSLGDFLAPAIPHDHEGEKAQSGPEEDQGAGFGGVGDEDGNRSSEDSASPVVDQGK